MNCHIVRYLYLILALLNKVIETSSALSFYNRMAPNANLGVSILNTFTNPLDKAAKNLSAISVKLEVKFKI